MRSLASRRAGGELTRRTTDLSTLLYEVSRILGGGGDLAVALTGTLRILHSFLGLAGGAVLLQARGGGPLRVAASLTPQLPGRADTPQPPEPLVALTLRHGLPLVVPADQQDSRRTGGVATACWASPSRPRGCPWVSSWHGATSARAPQACTTTCASSRWWPASSARRSTRSARPRRRRSRPGRSGGPAAAGPGPPGRSGSPPGS